MRWSIAGPTRHYAYSATSTGDLVREVGVVRRYHSCHAAFFQGGFYTDRRPPLQHHFSAPLLVGLCKIGSPNEPVAIHDAHILLVCRDSRCSVCARRGKK